MRCFLTAQIALPVATTVAFFGLIARPLATAETKDIDVQSSVKGKNRKSVLVLGQVEGKRVQLGCTLSSPYCPETLKPGTYKMVELPSDKGTYNDCPNVDIYLDNKKVGEYCLLENNHEGGRRVRVPLDK